MNILSWDIESSNLNADYGMVLCVGFKTIGSGKAEVISIDDYEGSLFQREKQLLKDVTKRLLEAECWLTWFGTYFDIPFVNSRLLYHRLPVLPANFSHIDGWRTAKNRLKLRNNRLLTVQDFLGLATEKDAVKGPTWIKALAGDKASLRYVIEHCRKDVKVLEEAYLLLRPLIVDHPNSNLVGKDGGCPACGADALQKRGWHVAKTRRFQRYQCQKCGCWSKGAKADKVATVKA